MNLKKTITGLLASAAVMLPLFSFSQVLPPDPGDNDNNPDVPFDGNMNMLFLLTGVVFAGFIVFRELHKKRKLAGK